MASCVKTYGSSPQMTDKTVVSAQSSGECVRKRSAVEKYRLLRETRRVLRRERLAQERNSKL